MKGNKTTLLNLDDSSKDKSFYFDYSFWSHNGYRILPNQIYVKENSQSIYAD